MTARAHRQTSIVDTAADQVRDMITDLTRTTSHRERLDTRPAAAGGPLTHFTRVPALLAQLQMTDQTSETGARSGTGFESRPAASIEALDTLVRIDLEAARWVRDLGEDDPSTTIRCVVLLGALLPSANRCDPHRRGRQDAGRWCCTWHAVEHDVRRWWTQARITTGWDRAAWCPDNTCPSCGVRRSLRIRLEERIGFCTECREVWPPDSYQVLAEHVREESDERRRAVVAAGPCVCRWPQATGVSGLAALCPRCGSASCEHAVRSTGRKAV